MEGESGLGAIACHLRHVLFKICICVPAFYLDQEGCWRTSVLCTRVHEFLYISHTFNFIYFLYNTHPLFNFMRLNLSLADTHGVQIHTHIHTKIHTHKKLKIKKNRGKRKVRKKRSWYRRRTDKSKISFFLHSHWKQQTKATP